MNRKVAIFIILFIFFIFVVFSIFLYMSISLKPVSIKDNSYLVIPIYGSIPEYSSKKFLFSKRQPLTIWGIYKSVYRAANDPNINGIILEIGNAFPGMAKSNEINNIMKHFKKSGKKVYAYMKFGYMQNYYLASTADKIYLIPSGSVLMNGFNFEVMFYKNLLEKLGVKADFVRIGDYKTAPNMFTKDKMTESHRETMNNIADEFIKHFIKEVSNNRNISKASLNSIFKEAFLSAESSLEYNLVDKLCYYDEIDDCILEKTDKLSTKKINKVYYSDYLSSIGSTKKSKNIALIFAQGQIIEGRNQYDPLFGTSMGSWSTMQSIKKARKNNSVKAIVFRINSPGGSAIAADEILRELKLTIKKKPIVVSMSNYAASGGYWISMASDKIIAHPLTLTASIGVFAGKFSFKNLYEKIGINVETIKRGKYADIFSATEKFTEQEKRIVYGNIKDTYNKFLGKVAKGRNMNIDEVDRIGKGRVWTGSSAIKLNLVDKLGGLSTGFEEAKKLAKEKLKKYEPGIIVYPAKKSILYELGISTKIFSKLKNRSIKRIRDIFPYNNYEALLLMSFIPEISTY